MNEWQIEDYDYLMKCGATWSQAMDWCEQHPLGHSKVNDLDAYIRGESE